MSRSTSQYVRISHNWGKTEGNAEGNLISSGNSGIWILQVMLLSFVWGRSMESWNAFLLTEVEIVFQVSGESQSDRSKNATMIIQDPLYVYWWLRELWVLCAFDALMLWAKLLLNLAVMAIIMIMLERNVEEKQSHCFWNLPVSMEMELSVSRKISCYRRQRPWAWIR